MQRLSNPAATDHDSAIVEHCGLAGGNGPLGLVEGDEDFVVSGSLDQGWRGLVAMTNLHRYPHRLSKVIDRDQVHAAGAQVTLVKMIFPADHDLLVRAADLNHVERRSRSHAESLTLAHREIVDAGVLADDFAVRGDKVAGSVWQCFALLSEVGIDEALVIATRHEANFLRVRLLRERQPVLTRKFADFWLGHVAKGEDRAAELLLRQAE